MIHQLNNLLHNTIPFFILLNFVPLIFLIILNRTHIKRIILKINKKVWIALLLIFMGGLLARIFIVPHQHIIYIDEPWYMEAAKLMLQTGNQFDYPKSIGWPFILSISFGIFGISNWVAIYTSILLGALTIPLIFLLSYIITKNKKISLIASLLFSLSPVHIIWSTSAETNVPSVFFTILTIFFCFLYFRNKKTPLLWLSTISLAFVSQFRPENHIFPFLFLIGCILFNKKFRINPKFILALLTLILLIAPNLIQVLTFETSSNWIESDSIGEQTGSNLSIYNLIHNSLNYGIELFNNEYQPIIIPITATLGLIYMLSKQKKEAIFLLTWFGLLWITYFSSYFQTFGAGERVYISFYPITMILASYGIIRIEKFLCFKTKKEWIKRTITSIIISGVIITNIPYLTNAPKLYDEDSLLLETKIPELAEKDIPKNCVIISAMPSILKSTTNLNVIHLISFSDNPSNRKRIFKENECILFFEDYPCLDWEKTPSLRKKCNETRTKFKMKPFKLYNEGNKTYGFYKILDYNTVKST